MKSRDTSVAQLAAELRVKPVTLYRYVGRRESCEPTEGASSTLRAGLRPCRKETPTWRRAEPRSEA